MKRLMRVCELKCHHFLHGLGGTRTDIGGRYTLISSGGSKCMRAATEPHGVRS
jgi:hypothetical protein